MEWHKELYDTIPCQQKAGQTCCGYAEHFETCYMENLRNRFYPTMAKPVPVIEPKPDHKSYYELTLTSTKDDPYELRQWIQTIADSKMFACKDMPYCIELTQAGIPHIHAILCSDKKYVDATKIKALGFPYRYSCNRVRNLEAFTNYINKEKENISIIEYCNKKGIPQFDNGRKTEQIHQNNL